MNLISVICIPLLMLHFTERFFIQAGSSALVSIGHFSWIFLFLPSDFMVTASNGNCKLVKDSFGERWTLLVTGEVAHLLRSHCL